MGAKSTLIDARVGRGGGGVGWGRRFLEGRPDVDITFEVQIKKISSKKYNEIEIKKTMQSTNYSKNWFFE
jgi:hypothetical protein